MSPWCLRSLQDERGIASGTRRDGVCVLSAVAIFARQPGPAALQPPVTSARWTRARAKMAGLPAKPPLAPASQSPFAHSRTPGAKVIIVRIRLQGSPQASRDQQLEAETDCTLLNEFCLKTCAPTPFEQWLRNFPCHLHSRKQDQTQHSPTAAANANRKMATCSVPDCFGWCPCGMWALFQLVTKCSPSG